MKLAEKIIAASLSGLACYAAGMSQAYSATCPPQYQNSWVAPQFSNATAVLNAALKSVDASLSTQLIFQSERLNSAVAVLTQQKALAASQLSDAYRTAALSVATGLGALSQT